MVLFTLNVKKIKGTIHKNGDVDGIATETEPTDCEAEDVDRFNEVRQQRPL